MKKPPISAVLYHDDADGFGAAFACYVAGGMLNATYIPVNYGQPVPNLPDGIEHLFIVDFSYPREICDELAQKYKLVVIDHHKTAEKELEGAEYAIFDKSKSGCVLTWEFFRGGPAPDLLRYVEDRDLWLWKLPESEKVNAYIATLPFDFQVWLQFDIGEALAAGSGIVAFRNQQIEQALKRVRICHVGGYDVPLVNATENISELGNRLCKEYPQYPFSVSYCDRADVRTVSLRSIGDFDVSEVAKLYGGGGHKNAAGYTVEL